LAISAQAWFGLAEWESSSISVNPPSLLVTPTTNIAVSGTQGGPFSPGSFQYKLSATYDKREILDHPADVAQRGRYGRFRRSCRGLTSLIRRL
jgi:hypothetical protein